MATPGSPEDRTVLIPTRLVSYVDELLETGLYGATAEAVVAHLLAEVLQSKVQTGEVRLRRNGRLSKR